MVAVLAGGTGGAKLARGMLDLVSPGELAVVANTGDDVEVYGVHVSPDPDLVTYWLCDLIDERRGFGVRDDSWHVMEALEAAGHDPWFRLGDRDLATCLVRTELLAAGERPTVAAARIASGLGVGARVLPMSDDPVRTWVRSGERRLSLQEFLIVEHGDAPIDAVEVEGASSARATPEALTALGEAEAIVLGPSNPVISIGPILSVPGIRTAVESAPAPVVAVSPFVGGRAVKGPTEAFCRAAGIRIGAAGMLDAYGGLLDGVIADQALPPGEVPALVVDTLMGSPARRRELARATLQFAASLAG